VILAGGTSGGMWKSSDGGQTWRKTTAPDQVHSVSCIAQNTLDGMSTVWVQEGASTIGSVVVDMVDVRQSDGFVAVGTHGNGVYTATVTELPSLIHRHLRGQ